MLTEGESSHEEDNSRDSKGKYADREETTGFGGPGKRAPAYKETREHEDTYGGFGGPSDKVEREEIYGKTRERATRITTKERIEKGESSVSAYRESSERTETEYSSTRE
jgi:hypothetical protein